MTKVAIVRQEGIDAAASLIDAFLKELKSAAKALPSSRCISFTALRRLVQQAQNAADIPTFRAYSGTRLVTLLEDAAVVHPIPLTSAPDARSIRLYAVGADIDPASIPIAELLQAYLPRGVLCYFTAIELHELSTQVTPHHHIAMRRTSKPRPMVAVATNFPVTDLPLPLGSLLFQVGDLPCYRSNRDSTLLRSTERRQLNPHCVVTVTTVAQTLLDCLHRPQSAGGPSVVFEVWERGLARAKPDRIIKLAKDIGDDTLMRRAAYMIERSMPDAPVVADLERLIATQPMSDAIPTLLPGMAYHHINEKWRLRTP